MTDTLNAHLGKIREGERVKFADTMAIIEEHFIYTPVKFSNGLGDDLIENQPGENQGSCKIFSLGRRLNLSQEMTLSLFGELYWHDVQENPSGDDHPNIRSFMKYGWKGISFEEKALRPRK
ncbi:MAG: HopJ type III effector protein [Desulfarculaceae bacterium]|jgi:hypothetical protein